MKTVLKNLSLELLGPKFDSGEFFIVSIPRNKSLSSLIGKLTICLRAEVTLIGTDFNVRRGVSIDNIARKGNNFLRYQLHTKIYVSTFYIVEYDD